MLLEVQNTGDPEQAKEILRTYEVKEPVISYLEATGQLLDGPALLKRLPEYELKDSINTTIKKELVKKNSKPN